MEEGPSSALREGQFQRHVHVLSSYYLQHHSLHDKSLHYVPVTLEFIIKKASREGVGTARKAIFGGENLASLHPSTHLERSETSDTNNTVYRVSDSRQNHLDSRIPSRGPHQMHKHFMRLQLKGLVCFRTPLGIETKPLGFFSTRRAKNVILARAALFPLRGNEPKRKVEGNNFSVSPQKRHTRSKTI